MSGNLPQVSLLPFALLMKFDAVKQKSESEIELIIRNKNSVHPCDLYSRTLWAPTRPASCTCGRVYALVYPDKLAVVL